MRYVIIFLLTFLIFFTYRFVKAKSGKLLVSNSDFLGVGQLLFPNHQTEFENFLNSFLADKAKFISEHEALLQSYDNFELEKLKAIEVLYIFGDNKEQIWITDWRGEENQKEIENFVEKHLSQKVTWTNTLKFRADNAKADKRDGDFVVDLFKQVDKDLQQINQRLIFFSLDWDAYVFTTVDTKSFGQITSKLPNNFEGTDKLRK
jgi:hypothetical protein